MKSMPRRIIVICLLVACAAVRLVAQDSTYNEQEGVVPVKKKDSGLSWGVNAVLTSNYIWRGLYVAGPSAQVDATINYKGLFANMWWNVGATDWTFTELNPELDLTIGFSRWGVTVLYMHMYYFDYYKDGTRSKFFDFRNQAPGGGGSTGEWRVLYGTPVYTSPKGLTTSVNALCGVRTFGRDGYYDANGELKRAYSSYIEVGCDQELGEKWTFGARVGITPAKSLYTGFQGDFAVTLVGLKLNKKWDLGKKQNASHAPTKCVGESKGGRGAGSLNAYAHMMLQPWQVNKDNLILPITQAGDQKLNLAVGVSWSM